MNIESTITLKQTSGCESTNPSNATSTLSNDNSTSFKDELASAKTSEKTDTKNSTENSKNTDSAQKTDASKTDKSETSKENQVAKTKQDEEANNTAQAEKLQNEQLANAQKNTTNNITQQVDKNKLEAGSDKKETTKNLIEKPLNELSEQIATLNELKTGGVSKTATSTSKTEDKTDKGYCSRINMNNKDITFFVNLVNNQQMTAQSVQNANQNIQQTTFADVKSEATQQTVQVSQTLMDAINKSFETNKPFRIDFDSDVAVIMKVDKNGVLSANFIPGSTAVENYLRNNMPLLQQNFENQNLPYNELSYSHHQQKEKQEQKQNNNKENENE